MSSIENPSGREDADRFVELASKLSLIGKVDGLNLTPFLDPALPHLSVAEPLVRQSVNEVLADLVNICEKVQASGKSVRHSAPLIWAFFKTSGYAPAPEFFSKIEEGDLVDVYNDKMNLIFANLRFFEMVSYSLEELYFRPWHELFMHEPASIQEELKKACQELLKPQSTGLMDLQYIGQHTVREISDPSAHSAVLQPTFFTRLTKNGQVAGFACINKVISFK